MKSQYFSILFAAIWLAYPQVQANERYALVIGNAAYPTSPLINPVNDATDMAAKLAELGFHVTKLLDANRQGMEEAIDAFARNLTVKDTVGVFFYAGHGLEVNGDNYLVPVDANLLGEEDVKYKTVNAGMLLDRMNQAGNGLNLVILDACRNNPFKRGWRAFRRQGLAQMQPAAGTLILYAAEPGKEAQDGDGRNGTLTKYLLTSLDRPGVEVVDAFRDVSAQVSEETKHTQVPWFEGIIHGRFVFRPPDNTNPTIINADFKAELAKCQQYLQTNSLISGSNGNAFECYRSILQQDVANTEARAGLAAIVDKYQDLATNATKRGRTSQAQELLAKANIVRLSIQALPSPKPEPEPKPAPTPIPQPPPSPDPSPLPSPEILGGILGQLTALLTALATLLGVIWGYRSKHNSTYVPQDPEESSHPQVIIKIEPHKETSQTATKPIQLADQNNKGVNGTNLREGTPDIVILPQAQLIDANKTGNIVFTQPIILNKSPMRIGRDNNNDIVINKHTVSSFHALIQFINGNFQIEDLQSGNGTSLNGKLVEPHKPMMLTNCDVISLDVYQFRFELVMGTTLRDPCNKKSIAELSRAELLDENTGEDIILTQSLLLDKTNVHIGRTVNNDLIIDRKTISSAHAIIQFIDGHFQVEDLHSANGTSVNGKRLAAHQPKQLASGDVISFDIYQFRFILGTILRV